MFDSLLGKKPLNLERKIGEKNHNQVRYSKIIIKIDLTVIFAF